MGTVNIYDRIYIKSDRRPNLVIEYVDGYCEVRQDYLDEWRLIDLDTGEILESSSVANEVIHAASHIHLDDVKYVVGWKEQKMEIDQ